jgi:hypothetical protein
MEDSPNVVNHNNSYLELNEKRAVQRYEDRVDGADEDDIERDEDANIDEDEGSIGEDDMIIEDEEPHDQEDEEMLLYER